MTLDETYKEASRLATAGKFAEALPLYEEVQRTVPRFGPIYNDLGVALYWCGRHGDAEHAYQTAIALSPDHPLGYANLGVLRDHQGRLGEAMAFLTYAAKLGPQNADTYNNLGDVLLKLSRFDEAEAALERSLRLNANSPAALNTMASVQWGQGRLVDATNYFKQALKLQPDNAQVIKNLGIVQLIRGQYPEGWRNYEARFKAEPVKLTHEAEPWHPSKEGPVFVNKEQGLGDQILHASMLYELAPFVDTTWELDPKLLPLFQRSYPEVKFHADPAPPADKAPYSTAIGSLGQFFRLSHASFPGSPYLLADFEKTAAYKARMVCPVNIGVSWASVGSLFSASKAVPLPAWAPVFAAGNYGFIDLQYGSSPLDRIGFPLTAFDDVDAYNDLDSLASLIMACDIVITISNTTAHLAGALGKETWVLVPNGYGKFWYWGDAGEKTPWYGSVKLFRQRRRETWAEVMERVALALKRRLAAPSPAP